MKLTKKLKDEYIKKIKDYILEQTGITLPEGCVYTYSNVASILCLDISYNSIDKYIEVRDRWSNGKYHFYYLNSNKFKFRHHPFDFLNETEWQYLREIEDDNNSVPALKEWNEMVTNYFELKEKKEQNQLEIDMMQLEFDDSIKLYEISKEYPGLYVKFHKTKLTFHQIYNKDSYLVRPKFEIKIKPVFITANIDYSVYNKKEFETKMNEVDY